MSQEIKESTSSSKMLNIGLAVMMAVILTAVILVSLGVFDPKPTGNLIRHQNLDHQLQALDERQVALIDPVSSSDYSIRMNLKER